MLNTYSYDAFGVEIGPDNDDANPFRYAGQYYDTETGTYYLRARYYDPATGRFTQQDSWDYSNPKDPLSLNLYVYCYGNPIGYFDFTGHSAEDIILGLALALDDSLTDGLIKTIVSFLKDSYIYYSWEDEADYYLGRMIGDVLGIAIGAGMSAMGLAKIIKAISEGAAITVGTGGTAAAAGVTIAVSGVIIGSVELSLGVAVTTQAFSRFDDDLGKYKSAKGSSFRGGKQSSRDNWYGITDEDFKKWWHRNGKKYYGYDIQDSQMAKEVYEEWLAMGSPKVK